MAWPHHNSHSLLDTAQGWSALSQTAGLLQGLPGSHQVLVKAAVASDSAGPGWCTTLPQKDLGFRGARHIAASGCFQYKKRWLPCSLTFWAFTPSHRSPAATCPPFLLCRLWHLSHHETGSTPDHPVLTTLSVINLGLLFFSVYLLSI